MRIQRLQLTHLRALRSFACDASSEINIIYGANGSGKTSLLEAIHLLSLGRSFRTHQVRHLISDGEAQVTSFAQVIDESTGQAGALGVERSGAGELRVRYQGGDIDLAALAKLMPVQVIDSDTFNLLDGSPSIRRQYLDWGSFHHSSSFIAVWRGFQRALKQRNSLLKYGKIDRALREVWDREFTGYAQRLTDLRLDYFAKLKPHFERIASQLLDRHEIELRFSAGWDQGRSLQELLDENFARDIRQGFTSTGPQRADLRFKAAGRNAAEHLSRGQKKLVVSALKLAQGALYTETRGQSCIYLIDDLPAELDSVHLGKFCGFLQQSRSQCFITCVDPQSLLHQWQPDTEGCLLKLEDGRLVSQSAFGEEL